MPMRASRSQLFIPFGRVPRQPLLPLVSQVGPQRRSRIPISGRNTFLRLRVNAGKTRNPLALGNVCRARSPRFDSVPRSAPRQCTREPVTRPPYLHKLAAKKRSAEPRPRPPPHQIRSPLAFFFGFVPHVSLARLELQLVLPASLATEFLIPPPSLPNSLIWLKCATQTTTPKASPQSPHHLASSANRIRAARNRNAVWRCPPNTERVGTCVKSATTPHKPGGVYSRVPYLCVLVFCCMQ